VKNAREGEGEYRWADGDRFLGEWRENQREGKGEFRWKNGDLYKGEWKNDMVFLIIILFEIANIIHLSEVGKE
jgi:hypothetical protein